MKVTNKTANAMVLGTQVLAAGASSEFEADEWDALKATHPVKAFLKADAISAGAAKAVKPPEDERVALFAELDKMKVTYDNKASTPELLVVLDEAKKKAKA